MGLFKRSDSRYWWMGYTLNGEHHYQSTKTTSKELATRVWKQRESEIVLGLFKVGWEGKRVTFGQLCEEFERFSLSRRFRRALSMGIASI